MVNIVICTHSNFAEGIKNAVEMIAGEQENLTAVNFMGDVQLTELGDTLKAAAEIEPNNTIFLVDLENATPFNAACIALHETDNLIITGVSLPMLLELVIARQTNSMSVKELSDMVIQSSENYIGVKSHQDIFGQ